MQVLALADCRKLGHAGKVSSMMKLYYSPGACSMASHIVLKELGLPHQLVKVDFATGTCEDGNFIKINPRGYVPTLKTADGKILVEGIAILAYLADQKADAGMLPKAGTFERYEALSWLTYIATEIHKSFGTLFDRSAKDDWKAQAKGGLLEKFATLDEHFSKSTFVFQNKFSAADAYLFTVVSWAVSLKWDLSAYSNLTHYMNRIRERPSVQEALKAENLV